MKFLQLLLLVGFAFAQTAPVWADSPYIRAKTLTLITDSVPLYTATASGTKYSYAVSFSATFQNVPGIIVGMPGLDMNLTTNQFVLDNSVTVPTVSGYTHIMQTATPSYINKLTVSYYAVDDTVLKFFTVGSYSANPFLLNNGATATQTNVSTLSLSLKEPSYIPTDTYTTCLYLSGFSMLNTTSPMSIKLSSTLGASNPTISLNLTTSGGNVTFFRVYYMVVHTNTTILENVYFIESGSITGSTGFQSVFPTFTAFTVENFMIGVSSFTAVGATAFNFNFNYASPYSVVSASTYTDISMNYLHFRVKTCNTTNNPWLRVSNDTCIPFCDNSSNYLIKEGLYRVCLECNPLCLTCSATNSKECVTCRTQDNRVLNTTTKACDCNTGFILATNTTQCASCHYTCLTCSAANSNTACLTCENTTRELTGTSCPCKTGLTDSGQALCYGTTCTALQYIDSTGACASCHYSCATCNITSTRCLTCGAGRTLSGTSCPCDAGTYDSGVATCTACNSNCSECTINATYCTACANTATRSVVGGQCLCSVGFFDTGAAACTACDVTCLTCQLLAANCTSCRSTRTLSGTNTCDCIAGYTETGAETCTCGALYYNPATTNCTATCDYSCLTCSINTTNCLTCPVSRTLSGATCSCNAGVYDTGVATCSACHYSCAACSSTAATCTSCPATRTLKGSTCECNLGLYDAGIPACQACNYTCQYCSGSATSCTSCVATRTFAADNSCPCSVGYYDAGVSTCAACNVTCLTCSVAANNCTSCNDTRSLTSSNTCVCKTSYLETLTNNYCPACDVPCLTCTGTASNCDSCPSSRTLNGTTCSCATGFYDTGVKVCATCNNKCLGCSGSADNCISCPSTRTLVGSTCVCSPGYWENGAQACTPDSVFSVSSISLAHGIVQVLCWCLLADFAIFVRYIYTFRYRVAVHIILMVAAVVGSIAVMAAMINIKSPKVEAITTSDRRAHVVIGYIVLAWVLAQLLLGIATRFFQSNPFTSPPKVLLLRRIHRYSGYLLILVCKINVLIGWGMNSQWAAFGVMFADIALILALFLVYKYKYGKNITLPDKISVIAKDDTEMYDYAMQEVGSRPYNDPFVQAKEVVVFDDKIYELPPYSDFHPGGRQIIKEANGRDIDRFLYGMSNLEMYPQLPAIEHPKNVLTMLGSPVGAIPENTSIEVPHDSYHVVSQRAISPNLSLFYLDPSQDKVNFKNIKDLRHIGQYFAVSAFGKTRLYSLIVSMTKPNRNLCDSIVAASVPVERRLRNSWDEVGAGLGLREELSVAPLDGDLKSSKTSDGNELPLIIKRYPNGALTNNLFNQPQTALNIEGPKGRGLCLGSVRAGSIAIVAGGTGLFPFLDLIDLIFKAVSKHTSIPANELKLGESALAKHSFHFFITVNNVQELIVPDQIQLICQAKNPRAKFLIRVKEGAPEWAFPNSKQEERFGPELVGNYIGPLNDLQMAYVCGPATLYNTMVTEMREIGISNERIFFV